MTDPKPDRCPTCKHATRVCLLDGCTCPDAFHDAPKPETQHVSGCYCKSAYRDHLNSTEAVTDPRCQRGKPETQHQKRIAALELENADLRAHVEKQAERIKELNIYPDATALRLPDGSLLIDKLLGEYDEDHGSDCSHSGCKTHPKVMQLYARLAEDNASLLKRAEAAYQMGLDDAHKCAKRHTEIDALEQRAEAAERERDEARRLHDEHCREDYDNACVSPWRKQQ